MRFTLNNFYQSNEWTDLLNVIRNDHERMDEEGQIICDFCGEPIVKAYDCIGHHTVELNEQNVNDHMISLNPELIQLVHHKCHNRIHDKFGYREDIRKVYLVYGSPLSGKTTWVNDVKRNGDLVVDVDNIWQCVSGCDRYVKDGRLNSVVFGVRDTLLDMVRHRCGKWLTAYVIGGYPLISERERLCRSLGAEEIFIDTTREECERRLLNLDSDVDCRKKEEWMKYISDWWRKYRPPGTILK